MHTLFSSTNLQTNIMNPNLSCVSNVTVFFVPGSVTKRKLCERWWTAVLCLTRFHVLAGELSLVLVIFSLTYQKLEEMSFVPANYCSTGHEISIKLSSELSSENDRNKARNSCIWLALPLHNTALDFSRLFYCSTVWSNTSQTNLSKLKAVHNFACCIVSGKTKVDHISSVLKEFGWLPVNELFYYRDVIMTFKCMTGHAPRYF